MKNIEIWHKDGFISDIKDSTGEVYQNGRLKDTKGKYEHLYIKFESSITDIQFYDKALTKKEIHKLYKTTNMKNTNISEYGCSTLGEDIARNRKSRRNWAILWTILAIAYVVGLLAFIYVR